MTQTLMDKEHTYRGRSQYYVRRFSLEYLVEIGEGGSPKIRDMFFGSTFKFFRRNRGGLAPMGPYFGLGFVLHNDKLTMDNMAFRLKEPNDDTYKPYPYQTHRNTVLSRLSWMQVPESSEELPIAYFWTLVYKRDGISTAHTSNTQRILTFKKT